jgi:hypothetical protein
MFDKTLVVSIHTQIDEALEKIASRAESIQSGLTISLAPAGMESWTVSACCSWPSARL